MTNPLIVLPNQAPNPLLIIIKIPCAEALVDSFTCVSTNKEPDIFIKHFNDIFKKIITIPIENEKGSMSSKKLSQIALKNKFNVEKANSFNEALKKISSKEKKLISESEYLEIKELINSLYEKIEFNDSDIQKILDNDGDCHIELVDEFEAPEMFYDKPWGSNQLRISFVSGKIIIHIN